MSDPLQLLYAPCRVRDEIPMKAGFGNPTQAQNLTLSDPLTAQIEGFQPYLYPGIGILEAPIPHPLYVFFAKRNLEHIACPTMITTRSIKFPFEDHGSWRHLNGKDYTNLTYRYRSQELF